MQRYEEKKTQSGGALVGRQTQAIKVGSTEKEDTEAIQ